MTRLLILISICFSLVSCGNMKRIEISNIERLYIDYNESQGINYGSTFAASVIASMNSGEEIDVTNHKKLKSSSEFIEFVSKNQLKISGHPSTFDDETLITQLTMEDKEESFSSIDSIRLNYRGPVQIDANGIDGKDAEDQRNAGTPLIGRNGRDGDNGISGQNGQDGGGYTVYVWKKNGEFRYHIRNDESGQLWKYKSKTTGDCTLNVSGGHGGNGGNGGNGGDGKDGKISGDKVKQPGNGGNGGNGGSAGRGGNGGSALIFVHSDHPELVNNIQIISVGGRAGRTGNAGTGGKGGNGASGQVNGVPGVKGFDGINSANGFNGPAPTFSVIQFDPNSLE